MMLMQRLDLLPHDVLQVVRRENGDRRPPGHEVMSDLQESSRPKANGERTIRLIGHGLGRMKEISARVRRGGSDQSARRCPPASS